MSFTRVKTEQEISAMRQSGKILATVLAVLAKSIEAGMTTKDLSNLAAKELKALGGEPAFFGYQGFPDILCVSINDEVVHGIPSYKRIINSGDIVGMDFGVKYQEMITDSAISVIVDKPTSDKAARLLEITRRALFDGISQVKDGCRVGDISEAIEKKLNSAKLGIVRELVGHGVGHNLHEDPNIPNNGRKNTGPTLLAGMTIAIEPMATLGSGEIKVSDDGWTVLTRDESLSAHFEHTVLITADGPEILTEINS